MLSIIILGHTDDEERALTWQTGGESSGRLPPGGALLIYEALIDDERRHNAFGLLMSLNMLIETPGGFDYTGADCCGWLKEAGFRQTRVEHLLGFSRRQGALPKNVGENLIRIFSNHIVQFNTVHLTLSGIKKTHQMGM